MATNFQSYPMWQNNANNREANAGQAIENREKQQEQEDKTDQQNNFLATLSLMQMLNGMGNQDPWSAFGSMLGMGLFPVGMQLGDKLFGNLFGKNNEATGVYSTDVDKIIGKDSVHPQPQVGNPIPENPLIINNPAERFKPNFSLLGDLNSLGGIQRLLNERIEQENNMMKNWGFGNNPLNRYRGR